jgi:hypothetical protein
MLVTIYKFDKQKYQNSLDFWNSEFNRGHIDLIHPEHKSMNEYFYPCEIVTDMFDIVPEYKMTNIYEIDNDYLVTDIIDYKYYSFSDYCEWLQIRGIELKGETINLYREYKIKKVIG